MYSATYQQPRDSYLQQPQQAPMVSAQMFKMYGFILSLLAAATLALGISNVVLTSEAYCDPWDEDADPTACSKEPYVWTWIASGIWASAPIFIAGLVAMLLSNNPSGWTRIFAALIFLSAIAFAPAMIILSAIEVWKGHSSASNFYKLGDSLAEGNIMVEDSPFQAKFALPLVITILGGIMFLMTGIITMVLCCCMQGIGSYMPPEPAAPAGHPIYQPTPAAVQSKDVYYPPRPQFTSQVDYQPTTGPFMATRYNSVLNPSNPGVMFGNFPSRAFNSVPVNQCNTCDGNAAYRFH
jgi:hypothetical protein